MATLVRSSLFLAALLLVGFLSVPSTARPCKSLFITFTIEPLHRVHQPNPNFIFIGPKNPTDDRSVTLFSEEMIRPDMPSNDGLFLIDRPNFPTFDFERLPRRVDEQTPSFLGLFPLPREGIDFDSLFDRSKDVLSVVVALLFGVGCGALTAATMYFAWMLVVGRGEEEEEFYSDYDDIPSPKKGGYVKIPEAAPAQVKEVA